MIGIFKNLCAFSIGNKQLNQATAIAILTDLASFHLYPTAKSLLVN